MALFGAGALMSTQARRALTALVAVSWVLMVCAVMRPLYFPDAKALGLGLEVSCRLIAAGAAAGKLRSPVGGVGAGAFLFGAGLLTLDCERPKVTRPIPK